MKYTTEQVKQEIEYSDNNGYNIWSKEWDRDLLKGNECEHCGKPCGENAVHVHITVSGTIVPNYLSEEDLKNAGFESQGCFPIGSGCAKKLLKKSLPIRVRGWRSKLG